MLVEASQRTGCRGVGVDVSPDCIRAAQEMVLVEDAASGACNRSLAERMHWVCGDCIRDSSLLSRLVKEHRVTFVYLYVYPTLLDAIRSQVRFPHSQCLSIATHTFLSHFYLLFIPPK